MTVCVVILLEEFQKKSPPVDRAHRRGTLLPSPASAAATELMLLGRSCCAQLASLLEVPPRPSSRCCQQHLDEGSDDETTS